MGNQYKKILITGGRVIDPETGLDDLRHILVAGGRIEALLSPGEALPTVDETLSAEGTIIMPGPVDLHVHLREPGFEYKETIRTGTRAAVRGGFTAVCCMPNTQPVNDEPAITQFIIRKALEEGSCPVHPIGAITKGQEGKNLAEMALLAEAGCIGFSDDGRPVMDSLLMRRALEYSKIFDKPIISHAEDSRLSDGGVMNEGFTSTRMGLRGIPNAAEEAMIARDVALCELTGGRLHIAHVSTAGGVRIIRDAKRRGQPVTAETCPHYFTLTEERVDGYNTSAKVNPPLRTPRDVEAIREGLADGTIDAIATDHAPHHREEKAMGFDDAPPGISGLETALAISLGLVRDGVVDMKRLARLLGENPARIAGLAPRRISPGADANLVIIDPDVEWTVNPEDFFSLGRNTPFAGMRLMGRAETVVIEGRVFPCRQQQ